MLDHVALGMRSVELCLPRCTWLNVCLHSAGRRLGFYRDPESMPTNGPKAPLKRAQEAMILHTLRVQVEFNAGAS